MDFFGIGGGEVILILVVAAVIVGPEKLVGIGRTLGNMANNLRKASSDLTTQVTRELEAEEKEKPPGQDTESPPAG